MRIFLLPISTRRTLLYCEKHTHADPKSRNILDRVLNKTNETWASWERAESGWKKSLTTYGNAALRRIPYEEWGLKTMPALTEKRKAALSEGHDKVEVWFPGLYMKEGRVPEVLRLLSERREFHRRNLIWSVVAMPVTAPFALVPVIPNIPFFYVAFRAYSHWKALSGTKTLSFLLTKNLLNPTPTASLDTLYTAGLMYPTRALSRSSPPPTPEQISSVSTLITTQTNNGEKDVMLLQKWNGKLIAESFELPEMEVEIERAVEQVAGQIRSEEELKQEKREIEKATGTTVEEIRRAAEENLRGAQGEKDVVTEKVGVDKVEGEKVEAKR